MLTHNLRIFLEVANRRSITETANARYISQPAVSKAIQKELSLKLFHRDKKNGMIPTEAGEKILLLARQMEDLENRIRQTAFRENNFIGGKLRIASVPVTTTVLLSKVLRQYRETYPYVTVEIKEDNPLAVQKMVEEHAVDFAVTYAPFGNLDAEILIRDEMVGILPLDSETGIIEIGKAADHMILCRAGMETVTERLPVLAAVCSFRLPKPWCAWWKKETEWGLSPSSLFPRFRITCVFAQYSRHLTHRLASLLMI